MVGTPIQQLGRHGAEAAEAAHFNALLSADADLARLTHRHLMDAQDRLDLRVGNRRLCNVLRPRILSRGFATDLLSTSERLAAIFERAGAQVLRDDRLLDALGASDVERSVWSIEPGYTGMTSTSRLDSFSNGTEFSFVEYNAESPASMGFMDSLSDIFPSLPIFERWEGPALNRFHARQALLDCLLDAFQEWGGTEAPSIAIIDWDHVITRRDFELCADFFREHNLPTVITDPRKLDYHDGALWYEGTRINLVYRRVLLHELLDHIEEAQGLFDAYRDGAVCMVNSPRSKLLHKKSMLALLDDPDSGINLDADDRDLLDRAIPWTRRLQDTETSFHHERRNVLAIALAHREELVLKPSDEYGGKGVVLGWETAQDEWERAIEAGLSGDYVIQERVAVPEQIFPSWDGGLRFDPLIVDTDPLLYNGKVGGILTRVSGTALLNVSAGTGSTAATFVVHEEQP